MKEIIVLSIRTCRSSDSIQQSFCFSAINKFLRLGSIALATHAATVLSVGFC